MTEKFIHYAIEKIFGLFTKCIMKIYLIENEKLYGEMFVIVSFKKK